MKARNARIFLDDIIESIQKIEEYTAGLDLSTFKARPMVTDAVLRNLEVIGEASGNIPQLVREAYPEIPWRRIVGLRNIVIHAYFNVDLDIVWQIITVNLPAVRGPLVRMRDALGDDG